MRDPQAFCEVSCPDVEAGSLPMHPAVSQSICWTLHEGLEGHCVPGESCRLVDIVHRHLLMARCSTPQTAGAAAWELPCISALRRG